jgi:hypothetical protein
VKNNIAAPASTQTTPANCGTWAWAECWSIAPIIAAATASHADEWPDDLRLSDIEECFTCGVCGKRGADVRPDFNWNKQPVQMMGYR